MNSKVSFETSLSSFWSLYVKDLWKVHYHPPSNWHLAASQKHTKVKFDQNLCLSFYNLNIKLLIPSAALLDEALRFPFKAVDLNIENFVDDDDENAKK